MYVEFYMCFSRLKIWCLYAYRRTLQVRDTFNFKALNRGKHKCTMNYNCTVPTHCNYCGFFFTSRKDSSCLAEKIPKLCTTDKITLINLMEGQLFSSRSRGKKNVDDDSSKLTNKQDSRVPFFNPVGFEWTSSNFKPQQKIIFQFPDDGKTIIEDRM